MAETGSHIPSICHSSPRAECYPPSASANQGTSRGVVPGLAGYPAAAEGGQGTPAEPWFTPSCTAPLVPRRNCLAWGLHPSPRALIRLDPPPPPRKKARAVDVSYMPPSVQAAGGRISLAEAPCTTLKHPSVMFPRGGKLCDSHNFAYFFAYFGSLPLCRLHCVCYCLSWSHCLFACACACTHSWT